MPFSLLPLLSRNSLFDDWDFPSRIADQDYGRGFLDSDLFPPRLHRGNIVRPRTRLNFDTFGRSEVKSKGDKFVVKLNVKHFQPNEVEVKVVDDSVLVHGKHEEKADEHGFISREFTRRYKLPEGTEPETVTSTFSSNGVLVIEAPKKSQPLPSNERIVPIKIQNDTDKEQQLPVSHQTGN